MINKKSQEIIILASIAVIMMIVLGASQLLLLRKAHSSFENYYAFRGCVKLISRSALDGTCQIASGETIRIVKYNGGWFLDGDLPGGFLNW